MASRAAPKRCKDSGADPAHAKRPAPHPGPRCVTCDRAVRTARRDVAWERRLWDTYHLTPEQYWALYEAQGGHCAICNRATGTGRRKLAVDHRHSCCAGPVSCGQCVSGLLCSVCNKTLGHYRDDVRAFQRAIDYLIDPPARRVIPRKEAA